MQNDELGTRMKTLEGIEANRIFLPTLPIMARIDGRCFSKFTKDMERPFDTRMVYAMIDTTKYLVEQTNAKCGYTQSDEISLTWWEPDRRNQILFNGRIQKLTSILASMATVYFFNQIIFWDSKYMIRMPVFDCRVWQVPSLIEGANTFLWREQDATKNAISMAASRFFNEKQLHKKNGKQMQEMLFQSNGINFNDYPNYFKRGTFVQKKKIKHKFTFDEINALPPNHEARSNPNLDFERSEIKVLNMPSFVKVTNREDVIYLSEEPKVKEI